MSALSDYFASRPKITVTDAMTCPNCGAEEIDPATAHLPMFGREHLADPTLPYRRFQIRAYRVGDEDGRWWSECLVCKAAGREAWFCDEETDVV